MTAAVTLADLQRLCEVSFFPFFFRKTDLFSPQITLLLLLDKHHTFPEIHKTLLNAQKKAQQMVQLPQFLLPNPSPRCTNAVGS